MLIRQFSSWLPPPAKKVMYGPDVHVFSLSLPNVGLQYALVSLETPTLDNFNLYFLCQLQSVTPVTTQGLKSRLK